MSKRVAYYYDGEIPNHYYGPGHPMKPHRLKLAHHLVLSYGLYRHLEVYSPHKATAAEMAAYHSQDYVDFVQKASPLTAKALASEAAKYNVGEYADCPIFDGLFDFCSLYCGASIDGAIRLNHGLSDICINWSGGLHHAKKSEASGFCYMNDIVLAILELLKYHARVLYIDIDIHHGDGVEDAFYMTDRVMTCSFHKFGDFFPGTGDIDDIGSSKGKYYSVNFPLKEGIGDEDFLRIFKPIIQKIIEVYRPGAVVLQCGADSLTGDRLGCFNLTLRGHGECVKYVKSFGLPLLVLGGGGYTINNVARCWAYETAVCLDKEDIPSEIPENDHYLEYYSPRYNLHLEASPTMQNNNTKEYLKKYKLQIMQNLSQLVGSPSVSMEELPPEALLAEKKVLDQANEGD